MKDTTKTPTSTNPLTKALQTLGPLAALLVVIVLFAILDAQFGGGQFATWRNARTVTIQSCTIAMAALGMTIVIISGGIDLSCGTAIALSATVLAWGLREDVGCRLWLGDSYVSAAKTLQEAEQKLLRTKNASEQEALAVQVRHHRERLAAIVQAKLTALPADDSLSKPLADQLDELQATSATNTPLAFRPLDGVPNAASTIGWSLLMGISTGVICGFLNGALVSYLRIVPFIVTLGAMAIFLGLGNGLGNNVPIRPSLKYQVPDWLEGVLSNRDADFWLGFPLGVWLTLLAAIVLAAVLKYSVFGRYVFALGSNEQTARLCGINVRWNKIAVYTLSGLMMGLAGVLQFSRLSSGNPMSGQGLELQVIAAVVIGGGSLNGGRGSILGSLAGAGIMAVIISGSTQLGMSNAIQYVILGVVIISAVSIDQFRQRMSGLE